MPATPPSPELSDPVHDREARGDLPTDEGPQGHRGVEVAARDVGHRGHHDPDRQAVGEGDREEVGPARHDDRARADEDGLCSASDAISRLLPST